jgi:hypothetical protein
MSTPMAERALGNISLRRTPDQPPSPTTVAPTDNPSSGRDAGKKNDAIKGTAGIPKLPDRHRSPSTHEPGCQGIHVSDGRTPGDERVGSCRHVPRKRTTAHPGWPQSSCESRRRATKDPHHRTNATARSNPGKHLGPPTVFAPENPRELQIPSAAHETHTPALPIRA